MLSITFEGRYTRQQFWLTYLFYIFSFCVLAVLVMLALGSDAMQAGIVHAKNHLTSYDMKAFRYKVLEDNRYNQVQKQTLEADLDRLEIDLDQMGNMDQVENMSAAELRPTQNVYKLSTWDWVVVIFSFLGGAYLSIFMLAAHIKRGHDLNISGPVTFMLFIIPVVSLIAFIYYGFFEGDYTDNEYGTSPWLSK